ncbi:MAG: bifunctional phosphoribosylaminoimidazolecarboxamide formyltransferase/IMP cyclohydrolase [Planctomycetota bacterium]|nr:bifunctional phosphoribosylaminoimidazolecarboxamide formyltransferase/IMP cyclohydrolase [Planctomycetota bacterium]
MSDLVPVRRALLSVYDKSGLVELGQALAARGVELISTGGSARTLREAGLEVLDVSDVTGFPEMMDGRVKTLHPKVHGGLLALRDDAGHTASMEEHGIGAIDLVVCNLYPFEATVQQPGVTFPEVIEQIDIGGPSMVRSSAKNHRFVAIVTEPAQYEALLEDLDANDGATSAALRSDLARAAFARTAAYDAAIARWLAEQAEEPLPLTFSSAKREAVLRYGENPHQQAALYIDPLAPEGSLGRARLLQGKAISFNNYNDVDAAWALVREFDEPACVIIKHANPCGAAISNSIREAYERAVECDPRSAFGGIVALNEPLTVDLAMAMAVKERFFEVLIAPGIEPEALNVFHTPDAPKWGKSLRVLDAGTTETPTFGHNVRSIDGGFLVQTQDRSPFGDGCPQTVTETEPTPQQARDLKFAWMVAKHTKSNAIVLVKDGQAVGVGAGQMSRVEATQLAALRAQTYAEETGEKLDGLVAASDAFYPFNDGIEAALDVGAVALVQPGGSRNDENAIKLCNERGVAMWFAGNRHFRH